MTFTNITSMSMFGNSQPPAPGIVPACNAEPVTLTAADSLGPRSFGRVNGFGTITGQELNSLENLARTPGLAGKQIGLCFRTLGGGLIVETKLPHSRLDDHRLHMLSPNNGDWKEHTFKVSVDPARLGLILDDGRLLCPRASANPDGGTLPAHLNGEPIVSLKGYPTLLLPERAPEYSKITNFSGFAFGLSYQGQDMRSRRELTADWVQVLKVAMAPSMDFRSVGGPRVELDGYAAGRLGRDARIGLNACIIHHQHLGIGFAWNGDTFMQIPGNDQSSQPTKVTFDYRTGVLTATSDDIKVQHSVGKNF